MPDCQDNNKCTLYQFQRNNYFYGKLMTVRDFEDEQNYINEKRNLLNRTVHGFGIVCGFKNISVNRNSSDEIEITFPTGGVALDCCGHEIVVPGGSVKKVVNEKTGLPLTKAAVTESPCLYLKYKPCYGEMVHAASNPSSCDETCCPNRIVEDFEVIASGDAQVITITCPALSGDLTSDDVKEKIREWLKIEAESCPECDNPKVFLAAIKDDLSIDADRTGQYITYVPDNKTLFDLMTCHMTDFNNPHKTTAQQTGALVSIDGVKGDTQGNVHLTATDTIRITPNPTGNIITVGESHSGVAGNPHHTKHSDLADVLPVDPSKTDDIRDKHVSNADANRWNSALGGGGAECLSGIVVFKDVAAGKAKTSSPIALPKKAFGIILGVIVELATAGYKCVYTGDLLPENGIMLGSTQNLNKHELTVTLTTRTDIKELKVIWWAVEPTKDMGSVTSDKPFISREHLVGMIAMNPNITMKAIMSKYDVSAAAIEETMKPLIEEKVIKVAAGTGASKKFIINVE